MHEVEGKAPTKAKGQAEMTDRWMEDGNVEPGDPFDLLHVCLWQKKVICGGSALENGARRIVESVLSRPPTRKP